jgi:hypothetical protein
MIDRKNSINKKIDGDYPGAKNYLRNKNQS